MPLTDFKRDRLACATFFMAPTLVYGIFTSRLPAFRQMLGLDDAAIGFILLCLGCATLVGLIACSVVVDRLGPKKIIVVGTFCLLGAITLASLASSYWEISSFCILAGLSVGFCDVALNAQGISIEQRYKKYCLGALHGYGSLGGALGAISGSICADFALSPFMNMLLVLGLYILCLPLAAVNMGDFRIAGSKAGIIDFKKICMLVYICAILNLVCHISEGSVGEWGSLLLNTVKGAPQEEAALAFAAFTLAMVCGRFSTDKIREKLSDRQLLMGGAFIAGACMALVLLSPWPLLCLAGYAGMGLGIAPCAPLLFSAAGASACVSPGQISSVVSIFSYAGLLVFPPFIGMLANYTGLEHALWLIVGLCVILGLGSFAFKRS